MISYAQYDQAGNIVKKIDPRGKATLIDYAATFQYALPTTTTSPVPDPTGNQGSSSSLVTQTNYDFSTGKPVSRTDPNGETTSLSYNDLLDRLTLIAYPNNANTLFVYTDSTPNPTVETRRDKDSANDQTIRTLTKYDGLGRVIQTQLLSDPQGVVYTDTTYDALGRKHSISNPYRTSNDITSTPCNSAGNSTNGTTTYSYDALSRITRVTDPDGSSVATTYYGNQTTVTDEAGKSRQSITDALGRLTQVTEDPGASNFVTTYSYDVLDDLLNVQQGAQTPRTFVYDSLKRLTSATNLESGTVGYTYDASGNLLTKTDARAITTTNQYDALNRVFQRTYNDGSTPSVNYKYDGVGATISNPLGHLTQLSSSVSTTNYTGFDSMGHVTGSSQITPDAALGSPTYTLSYGYNLAGEMISETYPSLRTVNTTYDAAGRANTVTGIVSGINKNYVQSIAYAPPGGMTSLVTANTLTETRSYNSRLQPTSICLGSLGGFNYDFGTGNNNGNVIHQIITAVDQTQTYSYDNLNRLTGVSETSGWSQTYGYDQYGNRNSASSSSQYMPVQVLTISTANNKIAATNYNYDAAGNLTQGLGVDGSPKTYAYDAANRMTNFNGQATYVYDGDGRRVKKVVGGTTTVFVYDAMGKLVAEYSNATPSQAGTQYITADHLGSTRVVTDAYGTVISRHDYLPFGETIPVGIGGRTTALGYEQTDGVNQKFTSKERDAESGNDYFGARYFGSGIGRFLSPDPIAGSNYHVVNPQRWNAYAYVGNNPLGRVDEK